MGLQRILLHLLRPAQQQHRQYHLRRRKPHRYRGSLQLRRMLMSAAAAAGEPVVGATAAHPPQDVVGGGAYVVQPMPVYESAALTQGGEHDEGKHNAGIEGEELSSSASSCAEGRTMRQCTASGIKKGMRRGERFRGCVGGRKGNGTCAPPCKVHFLPASLSALSALRH